MATSMIELQRKLILELFRNTPPKKKNTSGQGEAIWKVLVCDTRSRALLKSAATDDDVLDCDFYGIGQLEDSNRGPQPGTPVIYFLTPSRHIVKWVVADLKRNMYGPAWLIWTSKLRPELAAELDPRIPGLQQIQHWSSLNSELFPRESNLITFMQRDSFHILFNEHCEPLIGQHLHDLAQKIVAVCMALGEDPLVRYYHPRNANHRAAVLCAHLANAVEKELTWRKEAERERDLRRQQDERQFPTISQKPRAILLITDRTMDLMAPLVHELTYQAMAMDLLSFDKDALLEDRIVYKNFGEQGRKPEKSTEEESAPELNEKDKIWVENRHLHMKDLLVKLSDDFKKFQTKNSHFADTGQNISVNTIKDMLASLPEFQEGKKAFSLHINMAEQCAKSFQDQKLMDVTSLEQSLATGLDEDNQRPKNVTDQLVRLLADESVSLDSRARLLVMYIIYRGGIQEGDINKLQMHGALSNETKANIRNLANLGAKMLRQLGDNTNQYQPLYRAKETAYAPGEEVSLSRFEPMLRYVLEELCRGQLDNHKFPSQSPPDNQGQQQNTAQTLRRGGKQPTWANAGSSANKARQRIIVFMAGGATYSEARVCYEVSQQLGKEIFLTTTHMMTPEVFMNDTAKLHKPQRELGLAIDNAPPDPDWVNKARTVTTNPQQQQPPSSRNGGLPSGPRPPNEAMQNMNLGPTRPQNTSSRPGTSQTATASHTAGSFSPEFDHNPGKLKKKEKEKKEKKEHKFRGLLGIH